MCVFVCVGIPSIWTPVYPFGYSSARISGGHSSLHPIMPYPIRRFTAVWSVTIRPDPRTTDAATLSSSAWGDDMMTFGRVYAGKMLRTFFGFVISPAQERSRPAHLRATNSRSRAFFVFFCGGMIGQYGVCLGLFGVSAAEPAVRWATIEQKGGTHVSTRGTQMNGKRV